MYLGIDCGTQGTKALLVDGSGQALGRGYASHSLIERTSGAREQDPRWWVDALITSVRQALKNVDGRAVRALGVSGQQHGLVVLDESGSVIRPAKLWNDTETAAQNQALIERFGGAQAFFNRFGILPRTGYTVSKVLWLKEQEPENFRRIRHILLPHDYLNYWLTGEFSAEDGDASGTAFFDVRSRRWAPEILAAIDGGTGQLARALPPLQTCEQIVGKLRAQAAGELGLSADCMVACGGGDNMMGAIGTGNVRQGIVTLSLGTSCTVYSFRGAPVLDPTGNIAPFCSSSGGWLPLVCTLNGTNVVTQMLHVLGKTVDDIDRALGATAPGAGGLVLLPFFNGERTPDLPGARGSLLDISSNNFTADNVIRATVEGVSFGVLNGLRRILGTQPARAILAIGGGAGSSGWRQLLADAAGVEVQVPEEKESAALGAAMQAMFAVAQADGEPETFAMLAQRCVRTDAGKTVEPRVEAHDASRAAWMLYDNRLSEMHPLPFDTLQAGS